MRSLHTNHILCMITSGYNQRKAAEVDVIREQQLKQAQLCARAEVAEVSEAACNS